MLSLCLSICLGVVSNAKYSTKSKGVPEISLELCSKAWVPLMDHIFRQAKLSDNSLEENLCYLLGQTINTGENSVCNHLDLKVAQ